MSIHIIIDGYNLIRQSGFLSVFDRRDIQDGREALIDMLTAYKKIKGHQVTVVFDGADAPGFSQTRDLIKGIRVRFSRSGESADDAIKKMASKEREKALIVSSDLDVVDFAALKGCATISSPMFEEKIAMAAYMDSKGIDQEDQSGWIPSTKKKGTSKRMSKKKRRSRVKIQKL